MSDITKFKVGNDTYNIKDEESRNSMAETVLSTDNVPFVSKTMGEGKYQRKKFVGWSFVWNQLWKVYETSSGEINGITYSKSIENGSITISGTATAQTDLFINSFVFLGGIVYLMRGGYNENIWIYNNYSSVPHLKAKEKIFKLNSDLPAISYYLRIEKDTVIPTPITLYPQIVNLTQLFGSTTIADYIYNFEQATAGEGIAKLKELGFFTEDYYAYDAGSIQSVDIKEYSVTGKNLFNGNNVHVNYFVSESSFTVESGGYYRDIFTGDTGSSSKVPLTTINKLPLLAAGTYIITWQNGENLSIRAVNNDGSIKSAIINEASSGSVFTLTEPTRITLRRVASSTNVTFNNLQLELGSIATAYEPYHKTTYPLTPTELRGVPKIDANNNIYCDGDEYASDGVVARKYVIADIGTLNLSKSSASTSTMAVFVAAIPDIKPAKNSTTTPNLVCADFIGQACNVTWAPGRMTFVSYQGAPLKSIYLITDPSYTLETFKAAMSGQYLVYEKATPTTETLTPFDYPQSVGSLEEITDYKVEQEDRDVAIPTGHVTEYMGKGGEFTLPTLPTTPSVLAFDGHNFFWKPETT